jgi:hypothetical protein
LSTLLIAIPVAVLLTALAVGWLQTRFLIREGRLEFLDPITRGKVFMEIWLEWSNPQRLNPEMVQAALFDRLDSSFILAAQVRHQPAFEPYAYGKTYTADVLPKLVPRFLWPDKPVSAGGSDFVTRFSGLEFAEETSVGLPYQFELYANGGPGFVVVGLFVIGFIMARIERMLFETPLTLWQTMVLFAVLGVLTEGGEQAAITIPTLIASCVGSILIAFVVRRLWRRLSDLVEIRYALARRNIESRGRARRSLRRRGVPVAAESKSPQSDG